MLQSARSFHDVPAQRRLRDAVAHGRLDEVAAALAEGAHPMRRASVMDHSPFMAAVRRPDALGWAMAEAMVQAGAHPDVPAAGELPPLFVALVVHDTPLFVLDRLLTLGANPNLRTGDASLMPHASPLFLATVLGRLEAIERLLTAGARLDAHRTSEPLADLAQSMGYGAASRRLAQAQAQEDLAALERHTPPGHEDPDTTRRL